MIIIVLSVTVVFSALALQYLSRSHHAKHLVLHYHTPASKLFNASTDYSYKNGHYLLHSQDTTEYILLGEKNKIHLPDIHESFMHFNPYLTSAELYILPASEWVDLNTALAQIQHMKKPLYTIKKIASITEECNTFYFTEDFFKDKTSALICKYELTHYTIAFWIYKRTLAQEDTFQLILKLENKQNY